MELRQLRHFVAVGRTCHFSRAAETLHIAQPALSQSIRQLELDLGVVLFARTTRTVALTPAGRYLFDEACQALDLIDHGVSGAKQIAKGTKGLVRIAFTGTAAFSLLPRLARVVRLSHPDIALDICADVLTPAQIEGLTTGQLDLGVLRAPVPGPLLATRTVVVERMCVVLPADHRLAEEPRIDMTDLRSETFVRYSDEHSSVNAAVDQSCQAAGFEPRAVISAQGTSVLLALVAAGLGIALVPDAVRAMQLSGVVFRDVDGAVTSTIALAWRRNERSELVRQIISTLDAEGFFAAAGEHGRIFEVAR